MLNNFVIISFEFEGLPGYQLESRVCLWFKNKNVHAYHHPTQKKKNQKKNCLQRKRKESTTLHTLPQSQWTTISRWNDLFHLHLSSSLRTDVREERGDSSLIVQVVIFTFPCWYSHHTSIFQTNFWQRGTKPSIVSREEDIIIAVLPAASKGLIKTRIFQTTFTISPRAWNYFYGNSALQVFRT